MINITETTYNNATIYQYKKPLEETHTGEKYGRNALVKIIVPEGGSGIWLIKRYWIDWTPAPSLTILRTSGEWLYVQQENIISNIDIEAIKYLGL